MPIYLDYNATAPLRPEVVQAMREVLVRPLNASSAHQAGRFAKKVVEDTRRKLAEFLNCWPQEIIWCGSASEANNAVLQQFPAGEILVSAIEHSSVLYAKRDIGLIPVNSDGVVDLDWLKARLEDGPKPALISVMFANNETGVMQPVRKVVKLAQKYGVLVHTDAVQAVGKVPLDFTALGVDYMTISFHKNGGSVGIAALVVKNGVPFQPFIRGGGQEFNRRAGTENVAAIAGVDALLDSWNFDELDRVKAMMEGVEENILEVLQALPVKTSYQQGGQPKDSPLNPPASGGTIDLGNPKIKENICVVGQSAARIGNVSCLILPGISQEVQLMRLDLAGICVSAGSACTSGRIEPSHVLRAMGISDELAGSVIRVSAGWDTKQEDCEAFVKAYLEMFTEGSAGGKIAS